LEPSAEKLAEWIPAVAAELTRRRKATRQEWEGFYADLAELTDTLPHLKGKLIFRDEEGKLAPANGGQGGGRIYIRPDAEIGVGKRRRLSDAKLFPPRSLLKDVRFVRRQILLLLAITMVVFLFPSTCTVSEVPPILRVKFLLTESWTSNVISRTSTCIKPSLVTNTR